MFKISVSKDMIKMPLTLAYERLASKKVGHRTYIVKEFKISVEHGMVVTTLNIIKH